VEATHFAGRGAMGIVVDERGCAPMASGARLTLFWSNMRALSHEFRKVVSFPLPQFIFDLRMTIYAIGRAGERFDAGD
jgi:hypothetical protein